MDTCVTRDGKAGGFEFWLIARLVAMKNQYLRISVRITLYVLMVFAFIHLVLYPYLNLPVNILILMVGD